MLAQTRTNPAQSYRIAKSSPNYRSHTLRTLLCLCTTSLTRQLMSSSDDAHFLAPLAAESLAAGSPANATSRCSYPASLRLRASSPPLWTASLDVSSLSTNCCLFPFSTGLCPTPSMTVACSPPHFSLTYRTRAGTLPPLLVSVSRATARCHGCAAVPATHLRLAYRRARPPSRPCRPTVSPRVDGA